MDRNKKNNSRDNLVTLCRTCHYITHMQIWHFERLNQHHAMIIRETIRLWDMICSGAVINMRYTNGVTWYESNGEKVNFYALTELWRLHVIAESSDGGYQKRN
jgi:hypothetical protein